MKRPRIRSLSPRESVERPKEIMKLLSLYTKNCENSRLATRRSSPKKVSVPGCHSVKLQIQQHKCKYRHNKANSELTHLPNLIRKTPLFPEEDNYHHLKEEDGFKATMKSLLASEEFVKSTSSGQKRLAPHKRNYLSSLLSNEDIEKMREKIQKDFFKSKP